MSELDKLKKGVDFCFDDLEIRKLKERALRECHIFNNIDPTDFEAQYEQLKHMLGSVGENAWIAPFFQCDNGKNIHIGDNFIGNHNLTILDNYIVNIGSNVMIGPNTLISSVGHPLSPKKRREHTSVVREVNIGDDVWIGGNVSILPGVTIGDNVVIGAGSVVNRDIPSNSLAVGVPARVIKSLDNDLD